MKKHSLWERLCDALHPEIDTLIKIAKDCASGAVLCTVAGSVALAILLAVHLVTRYVS